MPSEGKQNQFFPALDSSSLLNRPCIVDYMASAQPSVLYWSKVEVSKSMGKTILRG